MFPDTAESLCRQSYGALHIDSDRFINECLPRRLLDFVPVMPTINGKGQIIHTFRHPSWSRCQLVDVHGRTADLLGVMWQAAVDPEIAELDRSRAQRRLKNYSFVAEIVLEKPGAAEGVNGDDVAVIFWSLGHPRVCQFWSVNTNWRYEWLASHWVSALLREKMAMTCQSNHQPSNLL